MVGINYPKHLHKPRDCGYFQAISSSIAGNKASVGKGSHSNDDNRKVHNNDNKTKSRSNNHQIVVMSLEHLASAERHIIIWPAQHLIVLVIANQLSQKCAIRANWGHFVWVQVVDCDNITLACT